MTSTNLVGCFSIGGLDSCHSYSFSFFDSLSTQISDTIVGPLKISIGNTSIIEVVLADYSMPTVNALHPDFSIRSQAIVRLLPSVMSKPWIVLTIAGVPISSHGEIDIFSVNGSLIRKQLA
jgi:hypothetical protein